MTSVTVDTSITFNDLLQIGQSAPKMTHYGEYFATGTQYFTINFDDVLKNGSGASISGYYDEFSILKNDGTVYYSIAISSGVFHKKNNTGETLSNSTIFKVNNAPNVTEIKLRWVPPYHPLGLNYMWHGNTTITFWKIFDPRINVYNNNTDAVITTTSNLYTFTIVNTKYLTFKVFDISSIAEVKLVSSSTTKIISNPTLNNDQNYVLTIDTTGMTADTYELQIDCINNGDTVSFTEFENDVGNTYKVNILIPYVFSSHTGSITNDIVNLRNVINLNTFVNESSVPNWSEYKIKFTYDGNEQSFDIDTNAPTFILDMLLKQFKGNVTCKFDILKKSDDSVVHTSDNFTLLNQNVTASDFNLTLHSGNAYSGNTILFQNDSGSQWIYMHESDLLNNNNIIFNFHVSYSKMRYDIYFIHGNNYSSKSHSLNDQLTNNSTQKIKLRVELTNRTNSADTTFFTDTTEFIIHKVDFSAFHTPTINPISNIDYFKEKTFRFTVSENFYSFTFDGITYTTENIIKSSLSQSINLQYNAFDQTLVDFILLFNPQSNVEMSFDIMDFNFTHGIHTLTFKIYNTIEGVQTIYPGASPIEKQVISNSIDIYLNIESDAIISCIPS